MDDSTVAQVDLGRFHLDACWRWCARVEGGVYWHPDELGD